MLSISEKLRQARLAANLTQEELAEKLDVSRQTISNLENGKSYPDIVSIIVLSDVYNITIDSLLKGDNEMIKHLKESTDTVKSNIRVIRALKISTICIILGIAALISALFEIIPGYLALLTIPLGAIALILSIIGKKKHLIALSTLVILSTIILWGIIFSFLTLLESLSGNRITFPNAENIGRVEIGTLSTTNQDDVGAVMSVLSGARRVSRDAMSPQPYGQNILKIRAVSVFYCDEGLWFADLFWSPLYLYTNDGHDQLWKQNVGIFTISQENSDIIRQLYTDLLIANNGESE